MDFPDPVFAIHGKAIDGASENDRVWFEQNPDRVHRLRDMIPFENNGPIELPPYGMAWKIIVTQVKSGMRFRALVVLPEEWTNEGFDDRGIAEIFKKVAPFEAQKILKAVKKERKKA